MNPTFVPLLSVWLLCICLVGCGGSSPSPSSTKGDSCTGIVVSGVLRDSLTNQPVSQGWAVLESGTQLSTTQIYNFSPSQQVASDVDGAFQLCASVAHPSAIVIVALDSSGKAYPSFVAPVSDTTNLGTIPMGGCTLKCGFEGQEQTSLPAAINGVITSTPISKTVSVIPQYSIKALDGSATLWNLAIPILNNSRAFTFNTVPSGCTGQIPFCAAYNFSLPSQKPVWPAKGGYHQDAGAPVYSIYAVPNGTPSCRPSTSLVFYQQDGISPLAGAPGVQLSAEDINLIDCQ